MFPAWRPPRHFLKWMCYMHSARSQGPVVTDSVMSVALCQCPECQNCRSGFPSGSEVFPWRSVTGVRRGTGVRRLVSRRGRPLGFPAFRR